MLNVRVIGSLFIMLLGLFSTVASANTATPTITCTAVTYAFAGFPNKPDNTVTAAVKVDGVIVAEATMVFTGRTGSYTIPINVPAGPHTVRADAKWDTNGNKGTSGLQKKLTDCVPPCVPGAPNPAGAKASGDAYGLFAKIPLISLPKQPIAVSTQSGVGTSQQADKGLAITVPGVAVVGGLIVGSTGTVGTTPSSANDNSYAELLNVNLLGGLIKAGTVRASVEAIARGDGAAVSDAGTLFQNLEIAGVTYGNVAPNTRISLPTLGLGAYVILRETLISNVSPAAGQMSGGTYGADISVNMIHVVVPPLLGLAGIDIVVSHASAHADFPQTPVCTTAAREVSGHAYGVVTELSKTLEASVVAAGVTLPATGGGPLTASLAGATVPVGLGNANLLSVSTQGAITSTSSTATSFAEVNSLNLVGGAVTATLVKTQANASATAGPDSSDATGTQFIDLKVLGIPVSNTPAPNTTYTLPGIGYVIFNEQFSDLPSPGHTGLTVRAIHLVVNSLAGITPGVEVIVSESHADATY